jgi:hypothetical protein
MGTDNEVALYTYFSAKDEENELWFYDQINWVYLPTFDPKPPLPLRSPGVSVSHPRRGVQLDGCSHKLLQQRS